MNKQLKHVLFLLALVLWAVPAIAQVDTVWVRRYDGLVHKRDQANAIAVDDSENVYVTGTSQTDTIFGIFALCTIKYKPNGDTAWVRKFWGAQPTNWVVAGKAIVLDRSGNAYITGGCTGPNGSLDCYTIKYRPDGDTAWVRNYNGPGWSVDQGGDVKLDSLGDVYVTGTGDSSRVLTLKYDSLGTLLWSRHYPPWPVSASNPSVAMAVAVNRLGDVYVAGGGRADSLANNGDFLILKLTSAGDTVWARYYDGPAHGEDGVYGLAVDDSGNAYVTGTSTGVGSGYDWCTIKYRPNGDTAWIQRYNGLGNSDDYPGAIALDVSGSVYVTGDCWDGPSGGANWPTFKYDTSGTIRWLRKYDGNINQDGGTSIALDRAGNVYVGGYSTRAGTGNDFCIIKYNSAGVRQWIAYYDGPIHGEDWVTAIALDTANNVYVTGNSVGDTVGGLGWDYCTVKYRQVVGVEERNTNPLFDSSRDRKLSLSVASPIKRELRANYFLPQAGLARLELFDVSGRRVKVLTEGRQEVGRHEVRQSLNVPAGVYFVRLSFGSASLVRKGVVVR